MAENNEKNIVLKNYVISISLNKSKKPTIDFNVFVNSNEKNYKGYEDDIREIFEISTEEFFKSCDEKDKYSFEIKGKTNNINEIELKIINIKNKEQEITITLKGSDSTEQITDNGNKNNNNLPPNNGSTNKGNNDNINGGNNNINNDWRKRLRKLKNEYDMKIKKLKEENEKLKEDNEKLKKEIEEEKKKADEKVKVYLEIRERYELAAQRNKDILLKNSQL